ncbi:hypothetical protein [Halocatena marina]|uniref:Uncharacterized protein n=1 Tax=Halocatena marina TaxID=2934937 RepID=A0ABD5YVU4_9EURY|nr:hypothetical protein [Halocatena marina]
MSEEDLDTAIDDTWKAGKTGLLWRLCFIKNVYLGDTNEMNVSACLIQTVNGGFTYGTNEGSKSPDQASRAGCPRSSHLSNSTNSFALLEAGQP